MIFKIDDNSWEQFREEHKYCEFTATIGGKFTFLITPTGLGPILEIKCNSCGKQKDITNYDTW